MAQKSFDPTAKSKDLKGAIKRLAKTLRQDRARIALITGLLLLFTIGNTAAPMLLGISTNIIVESVNTGQALDFSKLAIILCWVVVAYIFSSLADFISGIHIRIVVQDLGYRLRKQAQEKIDRLSLGYIDSHQRGDLISRVTNDIDNMTQTLLQTLNNLIPSVFIIVGVLGMMFYLSWILALLSLIVFPVGMIFLVKILKKAKPQFRAQWKMTGEISAIVEESFTGHEIVAAYGLENDFSKVFAKSNQKLFKSGFKGHFYSQLAMPLMSFISNLSFVIIAVVGGYLTFSGRMSIGGIQAFIHYSKQLNSPISAIAQTANLVQSGAASTERIFEFLDSAEIEPDLAEIDFSEKSKNLSYSPTHNDILQNSSFHKRTKHHENSEIDSVDVSQKVIQMPENSGAVTFRNVKFGYDQRNPIINNLSFKVKPGQQIAIVGPTGAGKTTLINLLLRFYEIDSGEILLDGVNIHSLSKDELRARIGIVLQDTWLFTGTIKENIAFGAENPSDEEIIAAAKATGIDHLIQQLPQGYDTKLNEDGAPLSTGEKQLLTIARAYIAKPEILILDEATSSVDTRTEMLVQNAVNELCTGRTSFIIAHRLSTIRDADLIIVMIDGDVAEQGTHDSLLAKDGFYAKLYRSQFAGMEADFDSPDNVTTKHESANS